MNGLTQVAKYMEDALRSAIQEYSGRIVERYEEVDAEGLEELWNTVVEDLKISVEFTRKPVPKNTKSATVQPTREPSEGGCPHEFTRGERLGEVCGTKPKDGRTYCSRHIKNEGVEPKEKKIIPKLNSKKPVVKKSIKKTDTSKRSPDRVLYNHKKLAPLLHHRPTDMLFRDRINVVGKCVDDTIVPLTEQDRKICEELNFVIDDEWNLDGGSSETDEDDVKKEDSETEGDSEEVKKEDSETEGDSEEVENIEPEKKAVVKKAVVKKAVAKEAVAKEAVAKEAVVKEAVVKEAVVKKAVVKKAVVKKAVVKKAVVKKAEAEVEAEVKEVEVKEVEVKEVEVKEVEVEKVEAKVEAKEVPSIQPQQLLSAQAAKDMKETIKNATMNSHISGSRLENLFGAFDDTKGEFDDGDIEDDVFTDEDEDEDEFDDEDDE
jgi:hypothetical protein